MPDAHLGIGATVGSVIPTESAVIPAAVGVDIGCGMIAVETSLTADALPTNLDGYLPLVERAIPAGLGKWHDHATDEADQWYTDNPPPRELGALGARAREQFGTLGSGNHFFEVCLDERDHVWIVLHSGSRGVGHNQHPVPVRVCTIDRGQRGFRLKAAGEWGRSGGNGN